ncbi:hypothetical protein [Bradyrhizobium erythrophlei]|jgi:hypothetical protein|uniref:Uncharacterized protein n=1 Tax=Bradyrhizobium erythrophlei TaxID=1437360 RepID=A0A1M5QGD5_9BRAD|nr:hypothetical protein [Bradyrhizobium erythrophlei]SHH12921.1 hypothetical protein SAMN05444169_5908 [Bradyrhizobium erythrophlei]
MDNTKTARSAIGALKTAAEELDEKAGYHAGRFWAENVAERGWLARLREVAGARGTTALDALRKAIDPNNELNDAKLAETCFGDDADDHDFSARYIESFVKGAGEFFEEIEPAIPF